MPWLTVDDGLDTDARIEAVGNPAAGVFVRAASYCARNLTDGFVPDRWVRQRVSRQRSARDRVIGELLNHGLFRRVEGGYMVVPLHDETDRLVSARTRAEVEEYRREEARRKRDNRARRRTAQTAQPGTEAAPGSRQGRGPAAISQAPRGDLERAGDRSQAARRGGVPTGQPPASQTPTGKERAGNKEERDLGAGDPWDLTPDELRPELRTQKLARDSTDKRTAEP